MRTHVHVPTNWAEAPIRIETNPHPRQWMPERIVVGCSWSVAEA